MSACARSAQISSCSSAAARKVSAAPTTTECPCSRSLFASLPIVVVFPVPLTPTTSTTLGSSRTASRTSPSCSSSFAASSTSASPRSLTFSRPSSRCTSSAVAGTPTSEAIRASSSRSQAASSAASKESSASCSVSARRLYPSESRSRERKPVRSASSSPGPSVSPSRSAHVRAMKRRRLRGGRGCLARRPPRDDLRDAVGAHRDAVEGVGGLHRPLLVRDHDELRPIGEAAQELHEAADVRVVQGRFHLVEEVERRRSRQEDREQERDRCERLLAAREQGQARDLLARRAQLHLDAVFAVLVLDLGLGQAQLALTAREQHACDLVEVAGHGLEGVGEARLDGIRELGAQLLQLGQARLEVGALGGELVEPLLLRFVLLLRERVHATELLTSRPESLRSHGQGLPVLALRGSSLGGLEPSTSLSRRRLDLRPLDVQRGSALGGLRKRMPELGLGGAEVSELRRELLRACASGVRSGHERGLEATLCVGLEPGRQPLRER